MEGYLGLVDDYFYCELVRGLEKQAHLYKIRLHDAPSNGIWISSCTNTGTGHMHGGCTTANSRSLYSSLYFLFIKPF